MKRRKSKQASRIVSLSFLLIFLLGALFYRQEISAWSARLLLTDIEDAPISTPQNPPTWPASPDEYQSRSIAVYDLSNRQFLFRKNIDQRYPMASLTKLTSMLVALEKLENYHQQTSMPADIVAKLRAENASMAGFQAGDKLTYLDLFYATVLPSGSEAVQALARLVTPNDAEFVDLMNQKAQDLYMGNTAYKNAVGLDMEGHYTSARDLVKLLRYALKNPTFRQVFGTAEYRASNGLFMKHTIFSKLNTDEQNGFRLLGGKSGTTFGAGLCWATLVEKNGREFLVIILGAPLDNLSSPTPTQKADWLEIMNTLE